MRTLILILTCISLLGFTKNPDKNWNERKEKKMLTVTINQIPAELDPTKLRLIEHFLLLQLYSQTLVRVDESGELVSYLAKRWEYDSKKKEYVFTLDPEARFSDGTPVTAQDVAWSLSRHFWIGSPSIVSNYLNVALAHTEPIQINHIHPAFKVINVHTFSIQLKSFYHPLLHVLAMPGFSITKYNDKKFNSIGSGPLKLEGSGSNKALVFSKNKLFKGTIELNQVSILESSNIEETKKMFIEGKIDLALGLNRGALELKSIAKLGVTITPSESLAVTHAYFNTKKILANEQYRSTLSSILNSFADDFAQDNILIERVHTFFPVGIMPAFYYKKNLEYKKTSSPKETVKIIFNQNSFSKKSIDDLKEKLSAAGVSFELLPSSGSELLEALKNKNYDIVIVTYVGNFPDPDAFIDFINSNSPIHAGDFDSKPLFASLEKIRFESDQDLRLSGYVKCFHEFEKKNYFVPLFRTKIPIVHRSELSFPNTKFRYEGELWRIFWKN